MGRFPQPAGTRGSLKWIQKAVNERPDLINDRLRQACHLPEPFRISWISPLEEDDFSEYRDHDFLNCLGIELRDRPLQDFWPPGGPQWDALGRGENGEVFLVEAKAHVDEVLSPPTKASERSRAKIIKSLEEIRSFLGIESQVDWSTIFYQYTNRLAHLFLLRELNKIQAYLLFVYFAGDMEMRGPANAGEWRTALQVVKGILGLPPNHKLCRYTIDLVIDVGEIERQIV